MTVLHWCVSLLFRVFSAMIVGPIWAACALDRWLRGNPRAEFYDMARIDAALRALDGQYGAYDGGVTGSLR